MNRSDLADLTAFVSVADHLSFRAAASQLGVIPGREMIGSCCAAAIPRNLEA